MNSNEKVVKLWNGSKALEISRYGLDCKTYGPMIYKRPINIPEKNIIQEVYFRSVWSCNMQIRLSVCFSCIIGLNSCKSITWLAVPMPCLSRLWLKLREGTGQRPQRGQWPMLSLIWGIFSFSSFYPLGFGPLGWDLGLKAGFEPLRLGFGPQG